MAATPANPLDEFDAPQGRGGNPLDEFDQKPEPAGIARQLVGGIAKGIVNVATLPYWLPQKAAAAQTEMRKAHGETEAPDSWRMKPMEDMSAYRPFLVQPEPQGLGEKFAAATGEAMGSAVIPEMGLFSKADKLAKLAPTTRMRSIGHDVGERILERPKTTLATDTAAAAASGIGSEAAHEANLGPGAEIAAGFAAPMVTAVPTMAGKAARTLLRIPQDAFTPTTARWKADADGIFKKLGIPASADGSIPGETTGGQAAAYTVLANQLRRANVSPDQLETLLGRIAESRRFYSNSYAPDATALVDLDPSLQKLAGSLMRENPEVWRNAVDFMYARQTGLTPARGELSPRAGIPARDKMSPPITGQQAEDQFGTRFGTPKDSIVPMGQRERVGDAFKRALRIEDSEAHGHGATADMTDAQLEAFGKAASDVHYNAARAAGKGVDLRPTLNPILDRWEAAIADQPGPVRAALKRQIREVRQAIELRATSQDPSVVRGTASPFERFDNWKKYLDAEIGKYYGSDKTHNKVTGNALQAFKRELLDGATITDPVTGQATKLPGLDAVQDNGLGVAYNKARGVFSSVADSRRALDTGRKIWKGEAGIDEYKALENDEASQKFVKLGIHGGYEADTKNMPRGHDVTKLFDKPRLDEVLQEIIPRSKGNGEFSDVPERFGRYIANEQMIQGTPKRTYQGSPTAERVADDKAANELFDLADQLKKGGWQHVVSNFAADVLTKMFGYRADTAATMGRVLFTADPMQRANAIREIRKVMSADDFSRFQQLMDGQARRIVQSGAASVAPVAAQQGDPLQVSVDRGAAPGTAANPIRVQSAQEAASLPPNPDGSPAHFVTPDGRPKINRPK